jgi:hypothetical protein
MVQLVKLAEVEALHMPPPYLPAVFALRLVLVICGEALEGQYIPPPSKLWAWLPLIVQLVSNGEQDSKYMPPPYWLALLPISAQSAMSAEDIQYIPPP